MEKFNCGIWKFCVLILSIWVGCRSIPGDAPLKSKIASVKIGEKTFLPSDEGQRTLEVHMEDTLDIELTRIANLKGPVSWYIWIDLDQNDEFESREIVYSSGETGEIQISGEIIIPDSMVNQTNIGVGLVHEDEMNSGDFWVIRPILVHIITEIDPSSSLEGSGGEALLVGHLNSPDGDCPNAFVGNSTDSSHINLMAEIWADESFLNFNTTPRWPFFLTTPTSINSNTNTTSNPISWKPAALYNMVQGGKLMQVGVDYDFFKDNGAVKCDPSTNPCNFLFEKISLAPHSRQNTPDPNLLKTFLLSTQNPHVGIDLTIYNTLVIGIYGVEFEIQNYPWHPKQEKKIHPLIQYLTFVSAKNKLLCDCANDPCLRFISSNNQFLPSNSIIKAANSVVIGSNSIIDWNQNDAYVAKAGHSIVLKSEVRIHDGSSFWGFIEKCDTENSCPTAISPP